MAQSDELEQDPLVLIVPGLNNSGLNHWQSRWERQRRDCQRVDLGMWAKPHRNTWVNKLNLAIHYADRPVILVAHSLGCLAVAWWAEYERPRHGDPVIGALLVAPPDVEVSPLDERLRPFAPTPPSPLPFPSILVGSRNDPYLGYDAARQLARTWGSRFADAGRVGHINAESGLGDWPFGQFLLSQLLRQDIAPDNSIEEFTRSADPGHITQGHATLPPKARTLSMNSGERPAPYPLARIGAGFSAAQGPISRLKR